MATRDTRLMLYVAGAAVGMAMVVVALIGEILGWWNDLGVVLAVAGLMVTVALGFLAASRFQVRELGGELRGIKEDTVALRAASGRIESNTQRIEGNTERIEGNTQRIEANTERIGEHGRETVVLLREIRDRLPPASR